MIKKVAVIGAGVMGGAIAEHISVAARIPVLLYDNNNIAHDKVKRFKNASTLTPCNISDDLNKLSDVDWVIEAIIEDVNEKHKLYDKLVQHCSKTAIISSNTSTILRSDLIKNFSEDIKKRFIVTHFFNPPKYMQLLELISDNSNSDISHIEKFCENTLGKTIIKCNDTPGFIANRLGCFWLAVAIIEAQKLNISVENADKIMINRHIGIPKTGVFGLLDLIGIDVFLLIMKSLINNLPKDDELCKIYDKLPLELLNGMIKDGYLGRKGKGGFYRKYDHHNQVINLNTGLYSNIKKKQ